MMSRRNLLSFLGVGGGLGAVPFAGAAAVAYAAKPSVDDAPSPGNEYSLCLTRSSRKVKAEYDQRIKQRALENPCVIFGSGPHDLQCRMTVGEDGQMWLKIGDEWRRIVTERAV